MTQRLVVLLIVALGLLSNDAAARLEAQPTKNPRTSASPKTVAPKPKKAAPKRPRTLKELEGDVKKVRSRFRALMVQWENLRKLNLAPIPWLKPVDLQGDLRAQLGKQYRTLLRMRRATRQWSTYWKEEIKVAKGLLTMYRDVAPFVAELVRALADDLLGHYKRAQAAQKRFDEVMTLVSTLRDTALKRQSELKADHDGLASRVTSQLELIADREEAAKNAEEALARAQKGRDAERLKKATEAKKAADLELAKAQKELKSLQAQLEQSKERLEGVRRTVLVLLLRTDPSDSAELRAAVARLAKALVSLHKVRQRFSLKVTDALATAEDFGELKPTVRGDAKLFRRLHGLLKKHFKALKAMRKMLDAAEKMWATARADFQTAVDSLRDDLRHRSLLLTRAETAHTKALAQLVQIEKQLAEARARKRARAIIRLESQRKATQKQRDELATKMTAQREALQTAKRGLALHRRYLDVAENRMLRVSDTTLAKIAAQLTTARITLGKSPRRAEKLTTTWLLRNRRYLSVLSIRERYASRVRTLKGWQGVAGEAEKNLNGLLGAINLAVRAVDERLKRDVELSTKDDKKRRLETMIEEQSPFARHRAALRLLNQRRVGVMLQQRVTALNRKLLEDQLTAAETAEQVQAKDLELAGGEQKFVSDVFEKATHSIFEHKTWREVWGAYAKRAGERLATIRKHHQQTQQTIKLLQVEGQYYEYQTQLVAEELKKVKQAIGVEEAKRWRVIIASVGDWFRKNVVDLVLIILLSLVVYRLTGWAEHRIIARAQKRHIDNRATAQQVETLSRIASGVTKFLVLGLATVWFLSRIGVNVMPVLGGAAVFGLAISFGSQNLVRDVVTGFFILLEKHYAVGDMIEISGVSGTVETLTLRRTVIRSRDGKAHIFPNGAIAAVTNRTLGWSRVCVQIGVAYSSDLAKVQSVCDATGRAMFEDETWKSKLLSAPRFQGLTDLADSSLVVLVAGEIRPHFYFEITYELNRRLKEAFDKAGIEIPFPQRDVHLKGAAQAA